MDETSFEEQNSWRRAKRKPAEMFPCEDICRSVVSAVIGGMIAVLLLKLLENNPQNNGHREMLAAQRTARAGGDLNETLKQPQEHDERFC